MITITTMQKVEVAETDEEAIKDDVKNIQKKLWKTGRNPHKD